MNSISYKTKSANKKSVNKKWLLIDAQSKKLGRLASQVAFMIRGKHKTDFTPHVDCGDNIIIINANKVALTGDKWRKKVYVSYTGYPSGQKKMTPREMHVVSPVRIIEKAVRGMLPKNKLGRKLFHNMFVYEGDTHAHAAQTPQKIMLKY